MISTIYIWPQPDFSRPGCLEAHSIHARLHAVFFAGSFHIPGTCDMRSTSQHPISERRLAFRQSSIA
eukprot:3596711-Pleurochrysis_carterae.AAC.1